MSYNIYARLLFLEETTETAGWLVGRFETTIFGLMVTHIFISFMVSLTETHMQWLRFNNNNMYGCQ